MEFRLYTHAHEKYQPSFLITGDDHGTPKEAFETSGQFYRRSLARGSEVGTKEKWFQVIQFPALLSTGMHGTELRIE
jgi:hypothetical protein